MSLPETNTDHVLKNTDLNAVVLISSAGKAITGVFDSDSGKRKMLFFKEVSLNSPMEMLDFLDQYQPEKLQLVSASADFTLVPAVIIDKEADDDRQWLDQLPGKESREVVFSEKDPTQTFKLVFSESASNLNYFSQIRPEVRIRHLVNVVHENCSNNRLASIWSKVVCFFLGKRFFVIAYKNNEIKLANSFQYEVPADVLYYLLWVKNEVYSKDEEIPFYFNGLISQDSKLFQLLKSYLKDLNFGTGGAEQKSESDELPPFHTLGILLKNF